MVKGSASVATIESGSYWRLVMPALPAFALLAAAVPLLVPTFLGRMGDRLAPLPARRIGTRAAVAAVVVFSLIPIAVLLVASPSRAQSVDDPPIRVVARSLIVDTINVPVDEDVVRLVVRRTDEREPADVDRLRRAARTPSTASTAPATRAGSRDMVCELRGVDRCELRSETLGTTREHRFLDPNPPTDAVYRVGVAANWLDETDRGDVFALSPPVAPRA